ncbi:hypothetical protein [Actinomyces ruminicola]|uniref:hypothetical protein n=1 Tax=Actinomyces ruminicola TaxID=332524 RepID=UPI0011C8860A|nr:hypothetical protein [Actinomyces ruminicola]
MSNKKASHIATGVASLGIAIAAASAPDSNLAKLSTQSDAQQAATYRREMADRDIRTVKHPTTSGKK